MAPLLLLFLLITSFTVFASPPLPPTNPPSTPLLATHSPLQPPRHHHHPPASAPVHSPAPLATPPTHYIHPLTPSKLVKTPTPTSTIENYIPRTLIAVQGVVYVKACEFAGNDTLWLATPLLGAIVKLGCNNTKYTLVETANTDEHGYFLIEGPKFVTNYGAHKCNVVLVSAPNGLKPSNFSGGITGAPLRPEKKPYGPFTLYSVAPLAFEPDCQR
ncbi:hypothetical protein Lal_00007500 [Lupinus albus]|uniref:Uncharacterized protein n=1 Tax=Lupinus albus TaxID=3870 RepID=A0A6A5MX55_LUPAL|nr:hypothetical protein Lalb_Chr16g0383811 [Lupinus albus]KAF1874885.1 hypothetical protein Lal_00007500 [Lupinus albus]